MNVKSIFTAKFIFIETFTPQISLWTNLSLLLSPSFLSLVLFGHEIMLCYAKQTIRWTLAWVHKEDYLITGIYQHITARDKFLYIDE